MVQPSWVRITLATTYMGNIMHLIKSLLKKYYLYGCQNFISINLKIVKQKEYAKKKRERDF